MRGDQSGKAKAQIAIEFIVAYSMILIIFLVFFALVASQRAAALNQQEYSTAQLVAEDVAAYIDQAINAGNGYNATIPIVSSVGLSPYNLSITNTGVVIVALKAGGRQTLTAEAFSGARSLVINGTIIAGSAGNVILYSVPAYSGTLKVANRNGVIYINQLPQIINASNFVSINTATPFKAEMSNMTPKGAFSEVIVPNSPSLNPGPTNSISYVLWLRTTGSNAGSWANILGTNGNGNADGMGYSLRWCCGSGRVYLHSWSANGLVHMYTTIAQTSINDGRWHMIVGTMNALTTTTTDIFYLDGAQANSTSAVSYGLGVINNLYIGGGGTGGSYNGLISDVQIYNGILNSTQVSQLYNEGPTAGPITSTGLVGWWPLNGNPLDYSGNGNNGAAVNVTYQNAAQVNATLYSTNGSRAASDLAGFNLAYPGLYNAILGGYSPISNANGIVSGIFTANSGLGTLNVTVNAYNWNMIVAEPAANQYKSMVAWFPLDEGSGNFVYDVSGSNMIGTFVNPNWGPLPQNASVTFGSTASALGGTNTILINHNYFIGNALTVSGWLYWRPGVNTNQQLAFFESGTANDQITLQDYNGAWQMSSGHARLAVHSVTCGTVNAGQWYNVGMTEAFGVETLYINGTAICSWRPTYGVNTGVGTVLGPSNGTIMNFQIYNTSLNAQQMMSIYKAGIAGFPLTSSSQLEGWWPLSGTLNDYSIYGNNGVAGSTVTFAQMYIAPQPQPNGPRYAQFNGSKTSSLSWTTSLPQGLCNFTFAVWSYLNGPSTASSGIGVAQAISSSAFSGCGVANTCIASTVSFSPTQAVFNTTNASRRAIFINGNFKDHWEFSAVVVKNKYFTGYLNGANVTGSPTYVGCYAGPIGDTGFYGPQGHFNGTIADVMAYNSALNSTQIQQLYQAGINPAAALRLGTG